MRFRITTTLAVGALGLMTLAGCGSDDDPSAADDSTPSASAPAAGGASEEPSVDPSELPSLPDDLPTDIPSDLPTEVNLGDECPEINQVLTDASVAMEDMLDDPTTAAGLFTDLAVNLRAAAEESNDDVAAAAERVAAVYETLATSFDGTTVPDTALMTELTEAATALQLACTG